jgi:hypothetical protein
LRDEPESKPKKTNKMTQDFKNQVAKETIEIVNQFIAYATEDITIAKTQGCLSVTGTEHGCIDITFENGVFNVVGRKNYTEITPLLIEGNEREMMTLLINSYVIEQDTPIK